MKSITSAAIALAALSLGRALAQAPLLPNADEAPLSFEEANALAEHPRWISLAFSGFDSRQGEPAMSADLRAEADSADSKGYFLAQFSGVITDTLRANVAATGAELLDYVPNFAFIVRGTPEQRERVAGLAGVVWSGAFHPAYRLEARLRRASADPELALAPRKIVVTGFQGVPLETLRAQLEANGVAVLESFDEYGRWIVHAVATPVEARNLARAHDVQWVEPAPELTLRNDSVAWVVQTFTSNDTRLWTNGINGQGQVIGHIDGLMSSSSCYFSDPSGAPIGATHRKIVYLNGSGSADSHGTHTAGTSAGNAQPVNGSTAGRGLAYLAKIAHTEYPISSFNSVASTHATNGARTHTNSWGDDSTTAYNTLCNSIDTFQWNNEDNLVFFAVTNTSSLKNPENAKNLLAVGASNDGSSANNFCSGGTGPTADGRRKPEVFTPGCGITSASTGSCGTTSMTGTSMASPSATAAGALVREYFMDGFYPTGVAVPGNAFTPTGALVKAVLVNTSQNMTGITGYPSNQEGWGRINLDESLHLAGDTSKMLVVDVRKANGLTTGQSVTKQISVVSSTTPLEITLAFHDAPGTVNASNPVINNLDLVVTSPTNTVYLGNVFSASWSSSGGTADLKNNVERVALQAPAVGVWSITVNATNVPTPNQGYGLCITGDVLDGAGGSSNPTNYCTAGLTSNFCIPEMSAVGLASATAASGFVLRADYVEGNKQGILFYGLSGRHSGIWAPGSGSFLCVKAPVQRMSATNSGGTTGLCDGVLSIDWNSYRATHPGALGNPFSAGQVVQAQGWFRDPPAPGTTNLTDGLEFTVTP